MQKTASKNIISSRSYEVFTIELLYTRKLQIAVSKNDFEKTMHGRGPKLGSYVPLMSFNKLKSGIFEKYFNRFLWAKMYARFANFGHFCP